MAEGTWYTTGCPRNCYSTCSMRVEVRDGQLRRIEANPDNLATPEGVCLKGLAYIERVNDPDRLLHPLGRNSSGRLQQISWDEALDRICAKLAALQAEPQSVMAYTGSGTKGLLNDVTWAFWRLYGGYTTSYGDLCWPAGLEATRLTLGDNRHSAPWDLANARLIVFWGKNPAETNIHQMRFVEQAVENGAKLVVIDPRRTETSQGADLLIQPKPGTDGALALGIANQLFQENLVQRDFVERHVHGHEAFAELAAEFPLERAAEITGVPAPFIRELADLLGSVEPATICAGFGMQRYTNSGQTMRAILALLALTGNIGRAGAGWVYANLQSQVFAPVKDPFAFYPPEQADGVARVSVSTSRLGEDMMRQADPRLRMIWVERGNPLTQNPHTARVAEAFRSLEFRVVVDQFLTDTAREADIVLPAKTMFEQSDVINAYWHPYIQLKQKMIEPPGEVKPESEVYWLLAERLGFEPGEVASKIPGASEAEVDAYLERRLQAIPGLTLDRLRQGPIEVPGHEVVAWSDLEFATPTGKIELASTEASTRWGVAELPRWEPPEEVESSTSPIRLLTPNTKNRIHSQFGNLPSIRELEDEAVIHVSPADAESRGIESGDRVQVINDRGALEFTVALDVSLRSGCAWVTNGWWRRRGGSVNELSLGRETDMGHGAAFHDNLVEIVKLP
ncbi:MAG: molybdopterin-dependent oxidoreductase [bacterium]|nr:molybdopterin-dependent oxidoreductase [bacterium]